MFRLLRIPRSPWARLLVAPALVALLLGQTVATLHMATAIHVVCPEHGEAVEATAACDLPAVPEHGDHPTEPAGHEPHGHHACAVLHAWSLGGPPAMAPEQTPLSLEAPPAPSAPALPSRPALIAPWRIAPKNSPPSA